MFSICCVSHDRIGLNIHKGESVSQAKPLETMESVLLLMGSNRLLMHWKKTWYKYPCVIPLICYCFLEIFLKYHIFLVQHIANLAGNSSLVLPVPAFNVINGGSHAGNKLAMQVCMHFHISLNLLFKDAAWIWVSDFLLSAGVHDSSNGCFLFQRGHEDGSWSIPSFEGDSFQILFSVL